MKPIQVLHVDEDRDFGEVTSKFLERENEQIEVITETTSTDGLERLATEDIDCVVSNYVLSDASGLEFLEQVRDDFPDLPFILFTGKGSEQVASKAFSMGATDYMQKKVGTDQYTVLANRVSNYVGKARTEKRRQRHLDAIETAQEGISLLDEAGNFVFVNETYADIYGYEPSEMVGEHWELVYPEDETLMVYEKILPEVMEKGEWRGETTGLRADGSAFVEDHTISSSEEGELICTVREVPERELELAEARYQSITESVSDVIITADENSTIQFVNPAVEDVFGYAPEDVVGEPLTMLMPEQFRERHREAISRFIETGERQMDWTEVELPGQHRDGQTIPLSISFSSFDHRRDTRFTGVIRDISDRKKRERELDRERERFSTLFKNLPNPALNAVARDGKPIVQNVNPAFEDVFGVSSDEIEGELLYDYIVPDEKKDKVAALDRQALREGELHTELTLITADGPRAFRVDASIQNSDVGSPVGYAVYTDITERKEQERALRRRNDRLDEFAGIVAHDLRTPLTVATGYLELLQDNYQSTEVREIEDALSRAESVLDDTLTLAREGRVIDEVGTVDLEELAIDCWQTISTESATLKIASNVRIRADANRMRRIFENLFRNAVEHGGEGVTVRVGGFDGGYYVEDDGRGIPSGNYESVFEPGHTDNDEGTGFGLAIVRRIAEAHGWEVSASEGEDGGARFDFSGVTLC